jgi:hypothetical protein
MSSLSIGRQPVLALKPLVVCLGIAFGLTAASDVVGSGARESSPQLASKAQSRSEGGASIPVSNCNDQGPGSLRDAVTNVAVSGDTVDMRGLNCSTITLISGAITTTVDDLTIVGPSADMNGMTLLAGHNSQIFVHSGYGTLKLEYLTVTGGGVYTSDSNASGGCISSRGTIFLQDAGVKYCVAEAQGLGTALGGGAYARQGIVAISSTIAGNEARAYQRGSGGGGIVSGGSLFLNYSWLHSNQATKAVQNEFAATGGALAISGDVTILNSTISGNSAELAGGVHVPGLYASSNLEISNTTICDNYASMSLIGSGLVVDSPIVISNSTITGNVARNVGQIATGAGLYVGRFAAVTLQSTIVSGNSSYDGTTFTPDDIGFTVPGGALVGGANNLIGHSTLPLPLDTIITSDPRLGALTTGNGGPTPTKAPLRDSPSVNHGNNLSGSPYDQRGPGFPRVIGPLADIGAVESDAIFANGFD